MFTGAKFSNYSLGSRLHQTESKPMANANRLHIVTSGLFYPAFLGNMSYVAAEKLFRTPIFYDVPTSLLVIALLLHYVMDWAYTVINKEQQQPYTAPKFITDLIIVVCLYVAFRLALKEEGVLFTGASPWVSEPALWLLITKVCALLWEYSEVGGKAIHSWRRIKKLEVGMDTGFAVFYLAFLLKLLPTASWLLALIVLADALGYAVHESCSQKWKDKETQDAGRAG